MRRLALVLVLVGQAGCGGSSSPVCGDGKPEAPEQCDDGNDIDNDHCSNACLSLATRDVQIKWTMLGEEVEGFNETCTGLGAVTTRLELSGGEAMTFDADCNFSPHVFNDLAAGDYVVKATLLDGAGVALSKGGATTTFTMPATASDEPLHVTVDVPFSDIVRTDYTGNWFYKLTFAGARCTTALPPVAKTSIRLERDGVPVVDVNGVAVDGVVAGPCFDDTNPHSVNGLPWGPADVTITGLDSLGTPQFRATYPTFVGAGITNPPLAYDVTSLAPDAGVPDAGAPDAAPPDAAGG